MCQAQSMLRGDPKFTLQACSQLCSMSSMDESAVSGVPKPFVILCMKPHDLMSNQGAHANSTQGSGLQVEK